MKPWSPSGPSLYGCPASLSDVFLTLGCMLSRRQYKDILPNTPCVRCRRSGIHNTCSHAPLGCISPTWDSQVHVWHHCHHVFANSWTRQSRPSLFFPRVNNFSIVTTIAFCPFREARATFTTADGKVAESARSLSTGAFHFVLP